MKIFLGFLGAGFVAAGVALLVDAMAGREAGLGALYLVSGAFLLILDGRS